MSICIDTFIPNLMCADSLTGMHTERALAIANAILLPSDEAMLPAVCYEHSKYYIKYRNPNLLIGKHILLSRILDNGRTTEDSRAAFNENGEVVVRELASVDGGDYEAGKIYLTQPTTDAYDGRVRFWANTFVSAAVYLSNQLESTLYAPSKRDNHRRHEVTLFSRDGSRRVKTTLTIDELAVFVEIVKWRNGLISEKEEKDGPRYKDRWPELVGDESANMMSSIGLKLLRMKWGAEFQRTVAEAEDKSIMSIYKLLQERVKPLIESYECAEGILEDELLREAKLAKSICSQRSEKKNGRV